jgi:hypothetical protein
VVDLQDNEFLGFVDISAILKGFLGEYTIRKTKLEATLLIIKLIRSSIYQFIYYESI